MSFLYYFMYFFLDLLYVFSYIMFETYYKKKSIQTKRRLKMTQLKKRAIWTLIIWSIALIAMLVVFFSGGGPAAFLEGDHKVTLTRVAITAGFLLYFVMMALTQVRARKTIVLDERDESISRRAYAFGFHSVLYYTFLFGTFLYWLYKIHLKVTSMPVGWAWILAVSSMCVGFISNATATLIIDARMGGNGQS